MSSTITILQIGKLKFREYLILSKVTQLALRALKPSQPDSKVLTHPWYIVCQSQTSTEE